MVKINKAFLHDLVSWQVNLRSLLKSVNGKTTLCMTEARLEETTQRRPIVVAQIWFVQFLQSVYNVFVMCSFDLSDNKSILIYYLLQLL